jgi:N-acetyl-beta-hexosaminidase
MWGEHIDDNNIEQVVWPRSQSVAERLWSPSTVNSTAEAYNRMLIQHCRMLNRGFHPGPVDPADYCATIYV